jgi:hypothetical protein
MEFRLAWRVRLLALRAAIRQAATGRHVYLSTGCLAGEHGYCASMTGMQGAKRGGLAKFTNAACVCPCHRV